MKPRTETENFFYFFFIGTIPAFAFILLTMLWRPLIAPITFFITITFLISIIMAISEIISKNTKNQYKSVFAVSLGIFITYTSIISLVVGGGIVLEVLQFTFQAIIGLIILAILAVFFGGTGGSGNSGSGTNSTTEAEKRRHKHEMQMLGKDMENRHREEQERIRQKNNEF